MVVWKRGPGCVGCHTTSCVGCGRNLTDGDIRPQGWIFPHWIFLGSLGTVRQSVRVLNITFLLEIDLARWHIWWWCVHGIRSVVRNHLLLENARQGKLYLVLLSILSISTPSEGRHHVPFLLFFYKAYKRPLTPPNAPCFVKLRCKFFENFFTTFSPLNMIP